MRGTTSCAGGTRSPVGAARGQYPADRMPGTVRTRHRDVAARSTFSDAFPQLETFGRQGDSSATIVAPNVLNWQCTCVACAGYMSGHAWTDEFRAAYRDSYGGEPPIDVWAIHVYELDWTRVPMVNTQRPEAELTAFEGYVGGLPGPSRPPTWLTNSASSGVTTRWSRLRSIARPCYCRTAPTSNPPSTGTSANSSAGSATREPPLGSSVRFCMRR